MNRITVVGLFQLGQHRRAQVNDVNVVATVERQQPCGIFCQDLIIVGIRRRPAELAVILLRFGFSLRVRLGEQLGRIRRGSTLGKFRSRPGVGRRCEQNQTGAGSLHLLDQGPDARLIGLEPFLAERVIDAVIDAVAGNDPVRLGIRQFLVQPREQAGPPARVILLALVGKRFTARPPVDHPPRVRRNLLGKLGFDDPDIPPGRSDAVAQEEHGPDLASLRFRLSSPSRPGPSKTGHNHQHRYHSDQPFRLFQ